MKPKDKDFIKRLKNKDTKAYEELVKQYQHRVFSIAFGIVGHREEALDVSQEAFIKVFRFADRFKGQSSFYTWLYRIVINTAIDRLRSVKKADHLEYDDSIKPQDDLGLEKTVASIPSPENAALNNELKENIHKVLKNLSENHRVIIILREVEGLSYEEISQSLGISIGTVMSRIHHARINFQREISLYLQNNYKPN